MFFLCLIINEGEKQHGFLFVWRDTGFGSRMLARVCEEREGGEHTQARRAAAAAAGAV
jgi:hypothetical protein